jgi:hypothetical protein
MKLVLFVALMTSFFSAACSAQSLQPADLMQAMYCVTHEHGGWLSTALAKQKQWPVSAAHDQMGYPHQDRIILAVYETPNRGQLFDLTIWPRAGKRLFKLQNNGSFDLEKGRIAFVNEPAVGDAMTQQRPEVWAREAMRGQHFMLRASGIPPMAKQVQCTSYKTEK